MAAPFVTLQKLRFCDTDKLGHVNNAIYPVLYEAGRAEMLEQAGLLAPSADRAVVIARLEIDFLREMNWPATVVVETAIHKVGTKSIHTRQRALINGEVVSRAAGVLAVIDINTRRAVALSDEWRDVLGRYLMPEFF